MVYNFEHSDTSEVRNQIRSDPALIYSDTSEVRNQIRSDPALIY